MIQVAGGVVWNPTKGVAVVNQHNDSWSLPKGHVESGETLLDAAIREIAEETGIPKEALAYKLPLGSYARERIKRGPDDDAEMRTITFYLFTTSHETLSPHDAENPEARWVSAEDVSSLLTHPEDKVFFESIRAKLPH